MLTLEIGYRVKNATFKSQLATFCDKLMCACSEVLGTICTQCSLVDLFHVLVQCTRVRVFLCESVCKAIYMKQKRLSEIAGTPVSHERRLNPLSAHVRSDEPIAVRNPAQHIQVLVLALPGGRQERSDWCGGCGCVLSLIGLAGAILCTHNTLRNVAPGHVSATLFRGMVALAVPKGSVCSPSCLAS